jgi:hypothetical protein
MQIVNEIIGRTVSATNSSNVALNASQEAYAYLEAERKNELGLLLKKAVEILEKGGADSQTAFNIVAERGQYLKDLSRGNKMFYEAAVEIKNESKGTSAIVQIA